MPGIILCMRPDNERRRYIVTSSLIGWAHAQNDPLVLSQSRSSYRVFIVKISNITKLTISRCGIPSCMQQVPQLLWAAEVLSGCIGGYITQLIRKWTSDKRPYGCTHLGELDICPVTQCSLGKMGEYSKLCLLNTLYKIDGIKSSR